MTINVLDYNINSSFYPFFIPVSLCKERSRRKLKTYSPFRGFFSAIFFIEIEILKDVTWVHDDWWTKHNTKIRKCLFKLAKKNSITKIYSEKKAVLQYTNQWACQQICPWHYFSHAFKIVCRSWQSESACRVKNKLNT